MSYFFVPAGSDKVVPKGTAVATTPVQAAAKAEDQKEKQPLATNVPNVGGGELVPVARQRTTKKSLKGDGALFSSGRPPFFKTLKNEQIYEMAHMVTFTPISSSTLVSVSTAYGPSIAGIGDISSLTAVFDQYRIVMIEMWFIPRIMGVTAATAQPGLFATVLDFDDNNVLSSFQQALDYQNVVVSSGAEGHYRKWKPHCAMSAYAGAFGAFANVESPWIDAASTSVNHYGCKTEWQATDVVYTMDVVGRFTVQWRNVR